jgi:hypothetical protein
VWHWRLATATPSPTSVLLLGLVGCRGGRLEKNRDEVRWTHWGSMVLLFNMHDRFGRHATGRLFNSS